jgi:uncharacterized protein (TIGR02444 family)
LSLDDSPADRFWRFSLALYDRPGVAEACLALQDRHGLDVNILMWCGWHAAEGRDLTAAGIAAAEAAVIEWQVAVIGSLRTIRRRLKGGLRNLPAEAVEGLRLAIKAAELEAERIEQTALAALPAGAPSKQPDASANLSAYMALRAVALSPADRACLALISTACTVQPEANVAGPC